MTTNNMTMEQEIKALQEATEGMIVAFSLAYNNGPDIGVRRSGEIGNHDPRADCILVNDHCWLIAGDIFDAKSHERLDRVRKVYMAEPSEIYVNVRGQAIVYGSFVQIDLDRHKVKEIHRISDECGQLVLE